MVIRNINLRPNPAYCFHFRFCINDMLDYVSYDADTILYVCRLNFVKTINLLESNIQKVFAWFKQNELIANSSKLKSFFTLYGKISLRIHDFIIRSRQPSDLLGFASDIYLRFFEHMINLCSIANQKLNALGKVSKKYG